MAEPFGVVWKGVKEFDHELQQMAIRADAASKVAVTKGGHLIEARSKAHFSGTHKRGSPHVGGSMPNVVTGSLRRSIHVASVRRVSFGVWESQTGPSMVYTRRVELGFTGTDARGRSYHQPAYPFFQPGFDEALRELPNIYAEAWGVALAK